MSKGKLRIGIIGIGAYAALAHIPQLRATGRADVVAISRRNPERLEMARQAFGVPGIFTDWREMLDRVPLDAVVVSTPHHAHTEPVLAALGRGLHVLVEKPLALSRRDAQAMCRAAEQAGRVLMVGYQRRGEGLYRAAKQALTGGAIGRIRQVNLALTYYFGWMWQPGSPEETSLIGAVAQAAGVPVAFFGDWTHWHTDLTQMGGGAFVDMGSHFVDVALWLAGDAAGSAGARDLMAFGDPPGTRVERFINVQARLDNDLLLSITAGDTNAGMLGVQRLTVVGDEGTLDGDLGGELWVNRGGNRQKVDPLPSITMADAFVVAICDGQPNLSPARDGERVVALTEAAYLSVLEGRIVRVD